MATQFAVDLVFKSQGGRQIKDATDKLKGLEGSSKKAQTSLNGAANGIRNTGRAAATATANVQRFGIAFRSVLGPLVAVTGAVTFFSRSLETLGERQADVAALKNGLKGLTTNGTAALNSLIKSADKLGKQTLFNDEDFRKAFKLLTSFRTIGVSTYERVGTVAADMAQVLGQDVSSVMLQVAKALEAPEVGLTALQRSGTRFTDQQKEQVEAMVEAGDIAKAQAFILKELERQYGGAAKAAGSAGFAGAMDTLGEVFRDLQEAIGGIVEPLAGGFVKALTAALQYMNRAYEGVEKLVSAFSPLGEVLDSVGVNWENFSNAADMAGRVVAVVANDIAYVVKGMMKVVAGVLNGLFNGIQQFFSGIVSSSAQGMSGVVSNVVNGIRAIRQAIASLINSMPAAALSKFLGFDVGNFVTKPIGGVATGIEKAFQYGQSVVQRARGLDFGSGGSFEDIRGSSAIGGGGSGSGKKKGGGKGASDKAAREAEREAQLTARQLKAAKDRLFAAEQLLAKQQDLTKQQEIQLTKEQEIAKIQREYSELIEKAKSVEEEAALEKARGLEIKAEELKAEQALKELKESALSSIQDENALLEAKLAGKEKEYLLQKKINDLVAAGGGTVSRGEATALAQANQQLTEQVAAQDKAKQSAEALAGSISSALTDSLRGLIDGSMTAEEALSNAFKKIGDAFIDMAMQMIQEWIKMQIMGLVGSFFGGAGGGGGAFGGGFNPVGGASFGPVFAEGGFVTAPTRAMVGEGGSNEYVIPEDKMGGALARWNAGARGDAVLKGAETTMGGGGHESAEAPAQINVSGGILRFNDSDYIKADQIPGIVSQGAKQGEARALRRLQMSPGTRRKVGV